AARELLDRLLGLCAEVLVRVLRARHAHKIEALKKGPLVGEVVERREQLAPRQVAGRPEDDQRRRVDRQALEPRGQRVVGGGLSDRAHSSPFNRWVRARSAAAGSSPSKVTR